MIDRTWLCQDTNAARASPTSPRSTHDSPKPTIFFGNGDEVDQSSRRYEVMDEMRARPHPDLSSELKAETSQSIRRNQAAIGHATGEARLFRRASRPESCRTCSSVSAAWKERADDPSRAAASGSRWCRSWSSGMAARSAYAVSSAVAARLRSLFRSARRTCH